VYKHGAIAHKSSLERRTLRQIQNAVGVMVANCGYQIIQRTLFAPSLRDFPVDARSILRCGRLTQRLAGVYDVGGRSLEQVTQCKADGLGKRYIVESVGHFLHPGLPFSHSDFETQMRLAQAQPPSLLSILGRPSKKLGEKGGESFHGASQTLARKQRPQHRVPGHTGVRTPPRAAGTRPALLSLDRDQPSPYRFTNTTSGYFTVSRNGELQSRMGP
jgi:hypothetical protein